MKKLLYFFVLMVTGSVFGQDFSSSIDTYLNSNRSEYGLQTQDIEDVVVDRHSYSKSMDVENVYVVQRYQGIEIFNSTSSLAIRNGQVKSAKMSFSNNVLQKVNTTSPSVNSSTAISKAAQALGLSSPVNLDLVETVSQNSMIYSNGSISLNNIPVKLVYQKMEDNTLKLAWDLSIYLLDASHYYNVRIDATNGALLDTNDWVVSCNFGDINHSNSSHNDSESVLFSSQETMTVAQGGAQYRVYPLPAESPNHGPAELIADPSGNGDGSPFGWHDTDGAPGAEYTITRGNNVHAQDDFDGNNGTGISAEGGAELLFDYDFDFDTAPANSIEAATVNLFYMNNMMHDIWYQYGFNEESGNFQQNNYDNGGNGNDYVSADAQDGSGMDNATFGTPPDGSNPKMTMFLWGPPAGDLLTVNNGPLAGGYIGEEGDFGGSLTATPITEDIVLVEDELSGTADPNDACDEITNGASLDGKIAILRRGECEFGFKVLAAENEGAIAVIVVNNVPGGTLVMGGGVDGGSVTIPSIMVDQTIGEAIIAELLDSNTVNGSLALPANTPPDLDGDLDNGIIAHEYGHGISNRLTGGPNNTSCLNNAEQMGEGWSDFFGLILTIEPGDQAEDARGIGTFATGAPITGGGIRNFPYSTDMAVNPHTYADVAGTGGSVHAVGEIWATMIWDLNWALIDEYGFDADLYNGTGGNNIAMQLVIDGLKLQNCSPGFVDGRDAIIEADEIANEGENRCLIWDVFANRGLGLNASQGSSSSATDGLAAFDIPSDCETLGFNDNNLENNFIIYPNPSNGNINIKPLLDFGDAKISIYDMNGREVYTNEVSLQNTVSINAENLTTGLYIIQIKGVDYSHTAKLIIN
tara:strand:- start:97929 stop:100523 length:2595 start_codon:yes stop_codon:yes gene_type:complete